ncbi:pseudouridine synthase [Pseudovibrio sp. Tun.PSC04-5.I4]|uniref:pseudouridine synthase n=1 Tax=Pseudovibrio sp. Tun.PSC04-5.I4 TaxID=1798213 RepID=UPI000890D906|nr:pseudouridine synthase [Pseudovibrio sp. Tun.PSC04-5.I4]SDQ79113.1 23S rRNA pseudouridine2605 synthase [Pseudovibrio sp. Tun.PSC04-5.I4]
MKNSDKKASSSPRKPVERAKKSSPEKSEPAVTVAGERIAKAMARAGLCSRRDAETWVAEGRVSVNGTVLDTPAFTVTVKDKVLVDGKPLPTRERTRLWLFHKSRGTVTTNKDPEGRKTVFDILPNDMPRVVTIGRLDINTEGLLLLTNDGGLSRVIELPATGWLRRYRVRAYGKVTQEQLDKLQDGIAIDGVLYGAIEATLDTEKGDNVWLTIGLREGKNREVKRILEHLELSVNRLIRLSFGPFQLGDLGDGEVQEIKGRVLRDQLGESLIADADLDFDAPIINQMASKTTKKAEPKKRSKGGSGAGWISAKDAAAVLSKNKKPPLRHGKGPDHSGGNSEQNPFGDRKRVSDKPAFGDRKPSEDRGERKPFGDKDRGERKSFGDRDRGERKPFGDKDRGERKPFGDRDRGERKPFGDKDRGERKSFGDRDRGDAPSRFGRNERGSAPKQRRVFSNDGSVDNYTPMPEDDDNKKPMARKPEERRFGTRTKRGGFDLAHGGTKRTEEAEAPKGDTRRTSGFNPAENSGYAGDTGPTPGERRFSNRGPRRDDRDERGGRDGDKRPFNKGPRDDTRSAGGGDKRPFNKGPRDDTRSAGGDKRPFNKGPRDDTRSAGGDKRPFNKGPSDDTRSAGGDKRPFNKGPRDDTRSAGGDKRPFNKGPRDDTRSAGGDKRPFNKGPRDDTRSAGGDKRPFNKGPRDDTRSAGGDKRPFNKGPRDDTRSAGGDKRPFNKGPRDDTRSAGGDKRPFNKGPRDDNRSGGGKSFGGDKPRGGRPGGTSGGGRPSGGRPTGGGGRPAGGGGRPAGGGRSGPRGGK